MARHPALDRLESYLGARYSPLTKRDVLGQAAAFIAQSQGVGREYLLGYMDGLISRGLKPRSIHTIMSRLKTLYHANGWSWPLLPRDMHLGLPDSDEGGPALSPEDIRLMIAHARLLPRPDGPAVALATIWGLRPGEIAQVLSAGLDGRELLVQTSKLGRTRRHIIPEELRLRLTFRGREMGRDGLHKLFHRVLPRPPRPGEGFHSVRRSVVTGLLNAGVREAAVHYWMGWRIRQDMLTRYFKPDPADIDREVYEKHPFLPFWK